MAADPAGDVQQQIRELLAGKSATRSALTSEGHDGGTPGPGADAQELARRLVLGVTDSRIKGSEAITPLANAVALNDSILVQATHRRWRSAWCWACDMPLGREAGAMRLPGIRWPRVAVCHVLPLSELDEV